MYLQKVVTTHTLRSKLGLMEASTNSDFASHGDDHQETAHHYINFPLLFQPSQQAISKPLILGDELRSLRISLKWCALDHSTTTAKLTSYLSFIFFTLFVPLIIPLSVESPPPPPSSTTTDKAAFNLLVQFPESTLASLGFFTVCCFFKKYGLRELLFLDALQKDTKSVKRGYTTELDKAFRYLASILLPSFFVEVAHKIVFFSTVQIRLPNGVRLNSFMFVLVMGSWVYRNGVFLLVCVLFRLTCELQILRFEEMQKMFDVEEDGYETDAAGDIFEEHMRIRKQLSVTSHRYRFFIIASLVVVTASHFAALFTVLASKSQKSFFNSGDILVCSAVQLSGFFLCLLGAARITHRAQGIASVATTWHMSMTQQEDKGKLHCNNINPEVLPASKSNFCDAETDSESDSASVSDSGSDVCLRISYDQQPSDTFQTRLALVLYLQHNNKGITLFGYALDRGLLHTIFAFEFSLVMWILSKVVVLS